MAVLAQFVRNLSVFLILQSFIGILAPSAKYKTYIDLIMGLVLISLMLAPITQALKKPLDGILPQMEFSLSASSKRKIGEYYTEQQDKLVWDTYREELKSKLPVLVAQGKGYSFVDGVVEVAERGEHYGMVTAVRCIIAREEIPEKRKSLIRVEKVKVQAPGNGAGGEENGVEENEEIKKIKKAISDFYNLSVDHIYMTVQKKKKGDT